MNDDERLSLVAEVYRRSAASDGKPAQAVQRALRVSPRVADQLIRKAKVDGLLSRNTPRNNPKIVAVANRLGVPPRRAT